MGARFAKRRAVITMADGLPELGMYRGQCACAGALRGSLSGSRARSHCRAGSAHGWRPVAGAAPRGDGEGVAKGFCPASRARRDAGRDDPEAQHGAFGIGLRHAGSVDEVAEATINCLLRLVPAAVPGIAFLSGGQSGELASARLSAMNFRFKASGSRPPWALAFSFARAIQQPALEIWAGKEANREAAQQALLHRARCNVAARRGEYSAATEAAAA